MQFENHSTIKFSTAKLLAKLSERVCNILDTLNYEGEMYLVDTETKTISGEIMKGVDLFLHRNGKTYIAKTNYRMYLPPHLKNDNAAFLQRVSELKGEMTEYEMAAINFVPKDYDCSEYGEEIYQTCPCCGVCELSIDYFKEDNCVDVEFWIGKNRIQITSFMDDDDNDNDTEVSPPVKTFSDSIH